MSNPLTRWRARRPTLFRTSRFTRLFTGAAVILTLALSASVLAADPALAVSANGLAYTHGHVCTNFGNTTFPQADLCVEVAIYYPSDASTTGVAYIVPQVEGYCQYSSGNYDYCDTVNVVGEVSNGGDTSNQGTGLCTSPNNHQAGTADCEGGRNYFAPLGPGIPISLGACALNVWATVVGSVLGNETNIYYGTGGGPHVLGSNFSTAHYEVCVPSTPGAPSWYAA
jgi:hypothetical protein